ncbi:hypothetical protein [Xenorhabdus littoralis]|uniref:hypothetical protein n=1 Tax=Xenorhabdus littoralis TaxID=2582835 RepID=UPI0029E80C5C|nr:hypothetical protein [Xenorhabdus sp. Reich]
MAELRAITVCEWQQTVNDPHALIRFSHFINSPERDPNIQMVAERAQHRPAYPQEKIAIRMVKSEEETA